MKLKKIMKRITIVFFTLLFISIGLYVWGNAVVHVQQKEIITRYIDFVFETLLEEPAAYLLKQENIEDGIYIYHLDIANWDMEKSLGAFPDQLSFAKKEELLEYCGTLRFDARELSIISGLIDDFDLESCIIKERIKYPDPKTTMFIIYNEKTKECLLIASIFPR